MGARHVPPEQIEPLNESYGMPGYLQTEWEPEDVHASIIDFVFRDDAAGGAVSVVYRRNDGGYGLIEDNEI